MKHAKDMSELCYVASRAFHCNEQVMLPHTGLSMEQICFLRKLSCHIAALAARNKDGATDMSCLTTHTHRQVLRRLRFPRKVPIHSEQLELKEQGTEQVTDYSDY